MTDTTKATQKKKEAELEKRVQNELTAIDMDERYRDMLDDCYSLKSVGGPFTHMSAARVLADQDPTAYRCGFNDWLDGESRDGGVIEVGGEWYDADDVEKIRDEIEGENE